MASNILVPVDGSPTSNLGLMHAIKLAKEHGAALTVLHVVDENPVIQAASAGGGAYYFDNTLQDMVKSGRQILDGAVAVARKNGLEARPVLIEEFGRSVADDIVKQAKISLADMIVMGTHGRRGIARLLMGSDAAGVLRHSTVPVVLISASGVVADVAEIAKPESF